MTKHTCSLNVVGMSSLHDALTTFAYEGVSLLQRPYSSCHGEQIMYIPTSIMNEIG